MFGGLVPKSSPLESYGPNNLPCKHPAARYVRTLPMFAGGCTIRTFVELWTMCNFRSEKFYENREKQNEERNLKVEQERLRMTGSREKQNDDDGDDENKEEKQKNNQSATADIINANHQKQINLRRFRRGRRDGQLVLKNLPFSVIVKVSQFLKHNPVLRFGTASCRLGYHSKHFFTLDIVEDMEFDINRVVSFYLKASIDGRVVEHSRFFLNPDMTIGISFEPEIPFPVVANAEIDALLSEKQRNKLEKQRYLYTKGLAADEGEEKLMKEVVLLQTPGVMLFDTRFLEMKGVMCDGTKKDAFNSKWILEGSRM